MPAMSPLRSPGDPTVLVPLTYQWLKDGTNIIIGGTNVVLTLTNLQGADAATYSVVVSNLAGVAVSTNVALTVTGVPPGNTPPTFAGASDQTVNVGVTVVVTNLASDADLPLQTVTYSLLTAPGSATLDTNSAVFSWRPTVNDSDTTNAFALMAADNGTPPLTATQSFNIIVSKLTPSVIGDAVRNGSQLILSVNGQAGPDYAVQASTNLTDWSAVFITNSPTMPFLWTNPDVAAQPAVFYRIKPGPPLP
jgi:hypothetical protein